MLAQNRKENINSSSIIVVTKKCIMSIYDSIYEIIYRKSSHGCIALEDIYK